MKVLWLNAGLLLPLDKGGKLRTWHLLSHLSRRHEITWLSYADPDASPADLDGMKEVCSQLCTIPRRETPKGRLTFLFKAATHVFASLPYAVGAYRSRRYRESIRALLDARAFDVVVSDFLPPATNLPDAIGRPTVLFTHNVESEIWRRHFETSHPWWKKTLLHQQWQRILLFEREAVRRFDVILAVSDTDRRTLQRLYGPLEQPVVVIPTGVDTTYFAPSTVAERPRHLVFSGSMDWLPNEDGMLYFVHEILPLIRQQEPSVTVTIVGRSPTPSVARLASDAGIEVTGRVDDVRPYLAAAAVYIVPLRIGGGTRLKIFEAMSMGKAVVSTTVGAEGLPVTAGEHLRLADDPDEFAGAVVHLLRSPIERAQLGTRARHLVATTYDWAAAATELEMGLELATRRAVSDVVSRRSELQLQQG